MANPLRGEIWYADLNPSRGHEQAGRRPVLVVSTDPYNEGPADLVVVVPITSKKKGVAWHVAVSAAEAGLRTESYIMCDSIRCIAKERFARLLGQLSPGIIAQVEKRLRILLEL